jgi:deoxyribose-phosphate aldolase
MPFNRAVQPRGSHFQFANLRSARHARRMTALTAAHLARLIDFPLHRPDATVKDVERHCAIAREHHFAAVAVNTSYVEHARHFLDGAGVKVVAAIGFPLGAMDADTKRYETEVAVDNGAQEVDVVMNIGRLKDGDDKYVLRELRDVAEAADERIVKVIIETCLLTREEKRRACQLILDSGAHFVKTSTGYSTGGATVEDIKLLREAVGPDFGVKASGGIRDYAAVVALIEAGANRLGSSSAVAILQAATLTN